MRHALLLGLLLLAATFPLASAQFVCAPTAPGGTHACLTDWDEPDVICLEWQVGATHRDTCIMDPRRFLP